MGMIRNRRMTRSVAILSIVLLLLVSTSIFIAYTIFNRQLKEELIQTNMELLGQLDNKLEIALRLIDRAAIQLIRHEEMIRFFEQSDAEEVEARSNAYKVSRLVTDTVSSMEQLLSVHVYSYRKGRLVTGTLVEDVNIGSDYLWVADFQGQDAFSRWLTTRKIELSTSVNPVYRNVVTLVRSYPLVHGPNGRKGAIAVNVKEEALFALVRNVGDRKDGQTFVADGQGVVVLHQDKKMVGKDISLHPHMSRMLQDTAEQGYFTTEIDQVRYSVFYVRESYTGWYMVRLMPEVQFAQPLTMMKHVLLVLAVVLVVMAMASILMVGRWTFRPFHRFLQVMNRQSHSSGKSAGARTYHDEFHYLESTVRDIMDDREQLHRQVTQSRPLMKWQVVTDLLSNRLQSEQAIRDQMRLNQVHLYDHRYVVMACEFDNRSEMASGRDLALYTYALSNVAEELMNAESAGIAAELDHGRCAIIMSFDEDGEAETHYIRAVSVAELLRNAVQEYFGQTVTVGIAAPVQSLDQIRDAYLQALEALRYKLVLGKNSIITQEDIASDPSPQFYRLFAAVDHIVSSLKVPDKEKMSQQTHKWFASFSERSVSPPMIMQLVVQCLMQAATAMTEMGIDTTDMFPEQHMHSMLNQYEQLAELEAYVVETLEGFADKVRDKRNNRERNDVIDQVIAFIDTHYPRSDLSLHLLASEFGISVSHLSKLFKEQTAGNFIDYVMKVRMERAMYLLGESEEKIRDIAEQVGYSNVNSFVRIFKKISGFTPSEYRERQREHTTSEGLTGG